MEVQSVAHVSHIRKDTVFEQFSAGQAFRERFPDQTERKQKSHSVRRVLMLHSVQWHHVMKLEEWSVPFSSVGLSQ